MTEEVFESFHKVRSFECDSYGHVNNAVYLNYLEFARMEVLETNGLTLSILKEMGFMIVIRNINIWYKLPAFGNDRLKILTKLKDYRKTGGTFYQQILRLEDNKLLAEADVNWVVVTAEGKPAAIPPVISEAFGLAIPLKNG